MQTKDQYQIENISVSNTWKRVLGMTLNDIWWWGFSHGTLGNMEYPFYWYYFMVHSNPER